MCGDNIGICGWIKNSFIDFPGAVSTVLFFAGCNLRCPWCHNPDIVNGKLPSVPFDEVIQYVDKRAGIIDGVVLTGGEPTLHKSLPDVVQTLREKSLKIKIDTNGLNPEMLELCEPDYLALDIKTLVSRYFKIGCSLLEPEKILRRSVDIVKTMGNRAEIRITIVPEFIDEQIVKSIAAIIEGVSVVYLQPFNNRVELLHTDFAHMIPEKTEQLQMYRKLLLPYVKNCFIRGMSAG